MKPRNRVLLLDRAMLAMEALAIVAADDDDAIVEGRLFVDHRRIDRADQPLTTGQTVTWNAPRTVATGAAIGQLIVSRAEGFVAASKPAAWSSEPDRTGFGTSLRERLAQTLTCDEVHILTRLDVGVSGLVLAATSAESRRRWTTMARADVHRSYVAILGGSVAEQGTWRGAVEATPGRKPRDSITHFQRLACIQLAPGVSVGTLADGAVLSLVRFRPETGHRHQLRIHSARANVPILGDRRYGGPDRVIDAEGRVRQFDRIYLHALNVSVMLESGQAWTPSCPTTPDFLRLWLEMGGSERDLLDAVS